MKKLVMSIMALSLVFTGCGDDDDGDVIIDFTGESKTYELGERDVDGISGTATFRELEDGTAEVTLDLDGTPDGGMHPAHIHAGSAFPGGGDILFTFNPVDGDTGESVTIVTGLDTDGDGVEDQSITYDELLNYDGYINVHLSADDLGTLVAQGDIGSNEAIESKSYDLDERDDSDNSGTVTFFKRKDGTAYVTLDVEGDLEDGEEYPAHIHMNSAEEGGGIVFTFNPVNGTTGMSTTEFTTFDFGDDDDDNDEDITYDEILTYDGYVNVHEYDDLSTLVVQGNIGGNELTGETKVYDLDEKDVDGISGTATFEERNNGTTLVTLSLTGTPDGGVHPAHIHMNSAAEGGPIVVTFNPVNGTTGMSKTVIRTLEDGDDDDDNDVEITYEELLNFDGYINVHLSPDNLSTLVAQGDIGSNELTGDTKVYDLDEKDVPGISGTATFAKRAGGGTLVTLNVVNTIPGEMHPAHIHMNSAAEGGPIVVTFNPVNGDTGMSMTTIRTLEDDDDDDDNDVAISYDELLEYDGYINVHLSADNLGTIVAQGNIGSNEEED